MANLWRAESNDVRVGGVVIEWPSGVRKVARWELEAPIVDTLHAAKEYIAAMVQERIDARRPDDVERTNVPSLVAATQKLIIEWNEKMRAHIYRRDATLQ